MFEINHRKVLNIIKLKDIYYATKMHDKHTGFDAVYNFHCMESIKHAREFKTMLIDLKEEPEEILKTFRSETRAKIKKALANKEVYFEINEYPSQQELDFFSQGYADFAARKNIYDCNKGFLEKLQASGLLIIATALKGSEILCQFALITEELKTVSYRKYNIRFSNKNDVDKVKLISQANRSLEYQCMIHAKKAGKKYYDLCGITQDPNDEMAENVDQYKRGFRGQIVKEYHFMQPITFKGRLFCWLKNLIGGI